LRSRVGDDYVRWSWPKIIGIDIYDQTCSLSEGKFV
jgi:hypothetical protein